MLQQAIKQAIRDRAFIVSLIIFSVLVILFIVGVAIQIQPSDLQLPSRYSSFGYTNFYRDKWYYLLTFPVMGFSLLVFHIGIALKLYMQKGRQLALAFIFLGIALIITSSFTISALFRVVTLSQ